ncbi:hypothetical protein ACQ4PT_061233 [Festuca glaucescens]
MDCTPLKNLSRNSYGWKFKVRFARILEFSSPDQGILFSLDFVIIDQQKSTIEGLVLRNRADQFKDQLKEGSVYTIEKFDLYDPRKSYRSVQASAVVYPVTQWKPRYRFTVRATDTGSTDPHTVKFADFYLFGPRREVVVGKEALVLVSNIRAG